MNTLEVARFALKNYDFLSAFSAYKAFQANVPELKKIIEYNIYKVCNILQIEESINQKIGKIDKFNDIEALNSVDLGEYAEIIKLLWRGYANIAIPKITKILCSSELTKQQELKLRFALAEFYYAKSDYDNALLVLSKFENEFADVLLLNLFCHVRKNNFLGAHKIYERLSQEIKKSPIGFFLRTTFLENDVERLHCINEGLRKCALAPISLINSKEKLSFGNIFVPSCKAYENSDCKVSVIMPAYNSEKTIETSINSLLNQTWHNLEIIVVDDCSQDETVNIVHRLMQHDKRIFLLRQKENQGCYTARNAGLKLASGKFVTVHDADDWSHPQKIALQVIELLARPWLIGNYSYCLIMNEFLQVKGGLRPLPLFRMNSSSFLFRREIIHQIGGWESVRFAGDSEFIERIRSEFGQNAVSPVAVRAPLSFILATNDSLTRSQGSSLLTLSYFNSARGIYRQFYEYAHSGNLKKRLKNCIRALQKKQREYYDLVVVSDYTMRGGTFHSSVNYLKSFSENGKSVALLHWQRHDLKLPKLNKEVFDLCDKYDIDILTISDKIRTKNLLFYYPMSLRVVPDMLPEIDAENIYIACSQFCKKYRSDDTFLYDPRVIHQTVIDIFKKEPEWVAISGYIKLLMQQSGVYPKIGRSIWAPPFTTDAASGGGIKNFPTRTTPIIGRHGRDGQEKWPDNVNIIKKAYLVNSDIKVRFMGGARWPLKKLKFTPRNWEILQYNEISVEEFCNSIDFFVYFPHKDLIEAFGRVVIDAMFYGKVVILPPVFRNTFGNAAIYCEPSEVEKTVKEIWKNKKIYADYVKKGKRFVDKNCSCANVLMRFPNMSSNNVLAE